MQLQNNTDIEALYNNMTGSIICTFSTKLPEKYTVEDQQITISTDMDSNSLELVKL